MQTKKIGFIGGGNMATSLISGLIASGHTPATIWVADIDADRLLFLQETLAVNISSENSKIVAESEVIVLAVKPQTLNAVAKDIVGVVQQKQPLIVSVVAGVKQDSLGKWLGDKCAIVRCMPNTPALVQTSATALYANANVSVAQRNLAENILRAVGLTLWLENEQLMNAVTAVSGSGPAYFFLLMEAMEASAKALGLDAKTAELLIQQTALGAAKIVLESTQSVQQLRRQVSSPGGTTQKAIATLQAGGFEQLVASALQAAHDRSVEITLQSGDK